jgi:hypothetical protein
MKLVNNPEWESFDGRRFPSEAACRAHEAANITARFVGLTQEQVELAFDRTDKDLADAFEDFGKEITKKRIAADERRRRTKPKEEPPAAVAPPPPESPTSPPDDEAARLVPRYEEAGGF